MKHKYVFQENLTFFFFYGGFDRIAKVENT